MRRREVLYIQMLALLGLASAPRGRKSLAEELGVGEGVARSLIEGGRRSGHLEVMRAGVRLSQEGQRFLRDVLELCGILHVRPLDLPLCGRRCVMAGISRQVGSVVRLRDELVRRGACGAIIALKSGDRYVLPPMDMTLDQVDQAAAEAAKSGGAPAYVVACGDTYGDALGLVDLLCGPLV